MVISSKTVCGLASNKQNAHIYFVYLSAQKHYISLLFAQITFDLYFILYYCEMSQRKMWDEKEDNMIRKIVAENENRSEDEKWKWSDIAQILQKRIPGCKRSGKQCRQRWYNHLNPAIKKDKQLTRPEVDKLFQLQNKMGNRWANIAKQFPGRTDNNLKNFFYSSLRRAIRQINFFVAHYKKKSNIKPFKQSILTKILNISDQKYRQKLDIKSYKADDLAQNVKQMLTKLSLEQQDAELNQKDIQFRQKIVKSIQEFNKNCKKRKSKKVQEQEEPDLDELSQYQNENMQEQSPESQRSRKRAHKQKKVNKIIQNAIQVKSQTKSQNGRQNKNNNLSIQTKQESARPLFQKPIDDVTGQPGKSKVKQKDSLIDGLLESNQNFKNQPESKKSSSKFDSKSSGNNPFKLESSDFLRQSNASVGQIPRMTTRRSSSEFRTNFINNLQNWRKAESKCDYSLFGPDNIHLIDPMLESLNLGQHIGRIGDGSINQSGLFKMMKGDSKIDNGN